MMSNNPKKKQQMEKKQYDKPETKSLIMEDLLDDPEFPVDTSHPQDHPADSKENPWEDEEEDSSTIWEQI